MASCVAALGSEQRLSVLRTLVRARPEGRSIGDPYPNGHAVVPLVDSLLRQGTRDGAAMALVIAGGVSCSPAALAVRPLDRPRILAAHVGIARPGAVLAGPVRGAIA